MEALLLAFSASSSGFCGSISALPPPAAACPPCPQEYGLPSSHTLNTLCLNYMIVWYLYDRQLIAAGTAAILYCLVALWVSLRWLCCTWRPSSPACVQAPLMPCARSCPPGWPTAWGLLWLQVMWIAASRLYLGLHTPIDILAGAVAGLAVLVCFIAIEGVPGCRGTPAWRTGLSCRRRLPRRPRVARPRMAPDCLLAGLAGGPAPRMQAT